MFRLCFRFNYVSIIAEYICINLIKKKENPKRKSGTISAFGLPSKGAEGVRSHHKNNEEKILAHRRFGFTDEEVDRTNETINK